MITLIRVRFYFGGSYHSYVKADIMLTEHTGGSSGFGVTLTEEDYEEMIDYCDKTLKFNNMDYYYSEEEKVIATFLLKYK